MIKTTVEEMKQLIEKYQAEDKLTNVIINDDQTIVQLELIDGTIKIYDVK